MSDFAQQYVKPTEPKRSIVNVRHTFTMSVEALPSGQGFPRIPYGLGRVSPFAAGIELSDGRKIMTGTRNSDAAPLLHWEIHRENKPTNFSLQLHIENTTKEPLPIEKVIVFSVEDTEEPIKSASRTGWETASPTHPPIDLSLHEHLTLEKSMPPSRIGPIPVDNKDHSVDSLPWMTQLVTADDKHILLGFTTAYEQAGFIDLQQGDRGHAITVFTCGEGTQIAPGEKFSSEKLFVSFDQNPLRAREAYAQKVTQDMQAKTYTEAVTGWCSWYQFAWGVTEKGIKENVDVLDKLSDTLPVEYIVIDDQFDPKGKIRIGDWFAKSEKFPSGYKKLNDYIHEKNFKSILWLAPFIASSESQLYEQHPEWFVKEKESEKSLNVKDHWGTANYVLDTTNPQVKEYLHGLMQEVKGSGFDGIKIDFLFLATAQGKRYDEKATGIKALREGLAVIEEEMADRFVLYCGQPILPVVGHAKISRIGPDTGMGWEEKPGKTTAAMKYDIRSVWARKWMDNTLFTNDPDCIIARENNSSLTKDEVQSWLTTVAVNKVLLLGDDVAKIEPERLALLKYIFPPLKNDEKAIPFEFDREGMPLKTKMDIERPFDTWHLMTLFNWQETEATQNFTPEKWGLDPTKRYHVFDQWDKAYYGRVADSMILPSLPSHGVRVLTVHEDKGRPQVVGSTLHLLGGAVEIENERWDGKTLKIDLACPGKREGDIFIFVPSRGDVVRVPVAFKDSASLTLPFE